MLVTKSLLITLSISTFLFASSSADEIFFAKMIRSVQIYKLVNNTVDHAVLKDASLTNDAQLSMA